MYSRSGLYHLARYHQEQAGQRGGRRSPQAAPGYGRWNVFLRLGAVLWIAGSVGGAFYCALS